MLISHKYKFVILSVQKTASRSIRETYQDVVDVVGVAARRRMTGEGEFYQHATARQSRAQFEARGWDWGDYKVAAVVRNPWDRYLSAVNFLDANRRKYKIPAELCSLEVLRGCLYRWHAQYDFLTDIDGELIVTDVIEFDNLKEELDSFLRSTGFKDIRKLKHKNKSLGSVGWADIYSEDLWIKEVAHREWRVIEARGYKFPWA